MMANTSEEQFPVKSLTLKRKATSPHSRRTSKRRSLSCVDESPRGTPDIYYDKGESESEIPAKGLNDEDTQDDLVLIMDKKEDGVLSTAEIMEVVRNIKKEPGTWEGKYEEVVKDKNEDDVLSAEQIMAVVRNIKKDPDTLGGEYEEYGLFSGIDNKEKGKVPLPAPVVDTTLATVTCLIDGNVEFKQIPEKIRIGGLPKIKINIKKSSLRPKAKENELESGASNPTVPARLAVSTENPPPSIELVPNSIKPLLRKRNLQQMHPVTRGSEISSLCSIM